MNATQKGAREMKWFDGGKVIVLVDGVKRLFDFAQGFSGIGSKQFSVDGRDMGLSIVTQSKDIEEKNHFLYKMKWRDQPWDLVYILIEESELPELLNESNKWREPRKIEL